MARSARIRCPRDHLCMPKSRILKGITVPEKKDTTVLRIT